MTAVLKSSCDLKFKEFHGGGRSFKLICNKENKIVMSKALQLRAVFWYHNVPCCPGEPHTELAIKQHFTLTNMRKDVHKVCSRCNMCLLTKRNNKRNYGLLPEKEVEIEPREKLCIVLISATVGCTDKTFSKRVREALTEVNSLYNDVVSTI